MAFAATRRRKIAILSLTIARPWSRPRLGLSVNGQQVAARRHGDHLRVRPSPPVSTDGNCALAGSGFGATAPHLSFDARAIGDANLVPTMYC